MVNSKNQIKKLKHTHALVTGGSGGIGLATAMALSKSGIKTVVADLKEPEVSDSSIVYHQTDVTSAESVAGLFSFLNDQNQIPDLIVCNAGKGIVERLSEGDPEKWQSIFNLNVMGHLRIIRSWLPQMLEKETSSDIVFISSVAARKPYTWGGIYASSKAALQAIAETLRLEVQPKIRVSSILPGIVDTNFFNHMIGGNQSAYDNGWGALEASEIAEAVMYIISRPEGVAVNELTIRPAGQPF